MTAICDNISPMMYIIDGTQNVYLAADYAGSLDMTTSILANEDLSRELEEAKAWLKNGDKYLTYEEVFGD